MEKNGEEVPLLEYGLETGLMYFAAQMQVVMKVDTGRSRISFWSPIAVDQKSAKSGNAHFETSASSLAKWWIG